MTNSRPPRLTAGQVDAGPVPALEGSVALW